jgi:predicted nucleotidyltransferase
MMTRQIADYFKTQPVVRAWLFGSFARGEETPESDVDVLVEFDRTQPIGLFRYAQMHLDMEDMLGRKVDLVEDGMLRPAAALTAERDKRMIYERAITTEAIYVWDTYQNDLPVLKEQIEDYIEELQNGRNQ